MASPERLQQQADAIERRAAAIARDLAQALQSPTAARPPLAEPLAELAALHDEAGQILGQLRRLLGRAARLPPRPGERPGPAHYLRLMRGRMRIWRQVLAAAGDCAAGHLWPLVPEPRPRLELGPAATAIVADIFTLAHRAANPAPQAEAAAGLGCYPDIALNAARFAGDAHLAYRALRARKHPGPVRFLDVGCGGGMKVAMASEFFDEAAGLDYDPGYVEAASRNFAAMGMTRCHAFQADGLAYAGYGGFDVIYFFQPMSDQDGLLALERAIVAGARQRALLIAPYEGFFLRAEGLGCRWLQASVFVKGAGEDDLAALAGETRRMGPHVCTPGRLPPADAGWLRPLWLACEANAISPR